jgi:hypothetical protein
MSDKFKTYIDILIFVIGLIFCCLGIYLLIFRVDYIELNSADLFQDYVAAQQFLLHDSIYSDISIPNYHPPFVAILIAPLALIPYRSVVLIWSGITILLYFLAGWIILKELHIRLSIKYRMVLIGFALCWYPFQAHIALGQWSIQIGVCIILGWMFLRHGKDYAAGFLFGFACLIKLYPGLIAIYLLFNKRWKALVVLISVVIFGLLISGLLLGPQDIIYYFSNIASRGSTDFSTFPCNYSIFGILGKFFYDGNWVKPIIISHLPISLVAFILDILLLVILVRFMFQLPSDQFSSDIKFSMTIITMFFISPVTWQHMLTILILPIGLLISKFQGRRTKSFYILSLFALVLFSIPDIQVGNLLMNLYYPYRTPWYIGIVFLSADVGLVILWMLLLNFTRSKSRLISRINENNY